MWVPVRPGVHGGDDGRVDDHGLIWMQEHTTRTLSQVTSASKPCIATEQGGPAGFSGGTTALRHPALWHTAWVRASPTSSGGQCWPKDDTTQRMRPSSGAASLWSRGGAKRRILSLQAELMASAMAVCCWPSCRDCRTQAADVEYYWKGVTLPQLWPETRAVVSQLQPSRLILLALGGRMHRWPGMPAVECWGGGQGGQLDKAAAT
jgi:hypothetical protein